ncbi:hypothetical protein TREMEDRAFT_58553 [Tremella mesenterica DSM 1558]|uniref:uncharacterized protein n=1 Tax=Tremella mesenterica (strain ATCC 24925 / CBS 8224 / DSM 1558 / NBRC 9311 / NRRL Y-6157 / RJB 2259-6 / UBC 559-6) TaxID=578456 RepID=UPI0003F49307|nr:uncharacterized protein TREMEDRAFT_58553 [Tremella mesenterica DSM 1558]EIW72390.1 hypothetical protein TREMEDRAFT_58553 [Tremella mesenterica DSM 1558]
MPPKQETFEFVNGAVKPVLNGKNFFGWHQAVLDAAYAGGYVDILLSKSKKPVDPSIRRTEITIKKEPAVEPAQVPLPSEAEDKGQEGDGGKSGEDKKAEDKKADDEEDVIEVDEKGKVISMDQRRREFLLWEKRNQEALSLLLRSVDEAFHWQINGMELASEAWSLICDAHQFKQASVITDLRTELSKFYLSDGGDMQEHLRRFGTLVERGIKSGLPEFATDTARCDILISVVIFTIFHPTNKPSALYMLCT